MLSTHNNYQRLLFSLLLICLFNQLKAGSHDTIPLANTYSGYRIELLDMKISNKSDSKISGTITVVNSGKYPVILGTSGYRTSKLKVLFDSELDQNSKDAIITSIINSNMSLDPGDIKSNYSFNADILNYQKQWTTNPAPPVNLPDKTVSTPENAEKKVSDSNVAIIESEDNPVLKVTHEKLDTKNCPDLVLTDLSIKKQTKRNLQIEYTLKNQGNLPAQIYDKKGKEYLALAAYFSASGKLSRGSLIAGGDIITKGLEQSGGRLAPGESYTNTINIDISSKSRYLNTLILSADSRQTVFECIENNNNKSIPLR